LREVSDAATAIQVGQTARDTRFTIATRGAEQIAIVTPASVRMRPCIATITLITEIDKRRKMIREKRKLYKEKEYRKSKLASKDENSNKTIYKSK
jgi:hypothetical protein